MKQAPHDVTRTQRGNGPLTAGVALFDGVDDVSAAGPALVFNAVNRVAERDIFRVFTVTPDERPIRSIGGIAMLGDFSVREAPIPHILVLPGADGTMAPLDNDDVMRWVGRSLDASRHIITVCTGVRFLDAHGMTAGLDVTSHPDAMEVMRGAAKGAKVHADRVIGDNGRVIAASRLNGGIEASLFLVRRLLGVETASETSRLIEYDHLECRDAVGGWRG